MKSLKDLTLNWKCKNEGFKSLIWKIGNVHLFSFLFGHPCEEWNCPNAVKCREFQLSTGSSICINCEESVKDYLDITD